MVRKRNWNETWKAKEASKGEWTSFVQDMTRETGRGKEALGRLALGVAVLKLEAVGSIPLPERRSYSLSDTLKDV